MSFAFSSSSESEDDDDRPVTYAGNTEFIWQMKNEPYNIQFCAWPNELHCNCHIRSEQSHANQSMVAPPPPPPTPYVNGFGNSSMADASHSQMNGSRVLDDSILNTTPEEEITLIKVGGKFKRVRIITDNDLLPSTDTPEYRPMRDQSNVSIKIESPPHNHQQAAEVLIPLDRIDFTTLPIDPRINFTDYCYISEDEDSFPWTLQLPRFWREIFRQFEQNLNQERTQQGKPKLSTSYLKDRLLNNTQRFAQKPDPKRDPRINRRQEPKRDARLEQSLFEQPPRRVQSPSKSHNQSVPNLKSSIFDAPNTEADESSDSSSSSSLTFSSASENESTNKQSRPNDTDDDDEDLSFHQFKRRRAGDGPSISMDKNFSPINPKKTTPNKSKPLNGTKNLLFEKPPEINKADILNSLTDGDDSDDDDFEPVSTETIPQENGKDAVDDTVLEHDEIHTASNVPIPTGPEAINMLDSLINDVTNDNMDTLGDENTITANTSIPATATGPLVNGTESVTNKNRASVILNTADPISLSLTDNEAVDMEIDDCGNCAPIIPKAASPKVGAMALLTDQHSGGNENRNPIVPITTTPKTPKLNGVKNGRAAIEKEKNVSVEKKVVEKKVVSKKVPTKDTRSRKSTTKEVETKKSMAKVAETKKPAAKVAETKKSTTKVAETSKAKTKETEAKNISIKDTDTKHVDIKKQLPPVLKKVKRAKVIIVNMDLDFYEQIDDMAIDPIAMDPLAIIPLNNNDSELSDDDFENDVPCKIDELTLPNSNTDPEVVDKLKTTCGLCQYQAPKGWKQLTKHYVRKHPNCEIPISRLAKDQDPGYLSMNPFTPEITKNSAGVMVKSHCPICNEVYGMYSDKWVQHFVAHTGEYEYRCNKCQQELSQDLHKKCNSMNNDRINTHNFVDDVLYGYVCHLCKYIQLSKENVKKHLDREHQQINFNDENIVEIKLLRNSAKVYLMDAIDSKFEKNLVEAKQRINPTDEVQHDDVFDMIDLPVNSDDDAGEDVLIDLTLSDEDI